MVEFFLNVWDKICSKHLTPTSPLAPAVRELKSKLPLNSRTVINVNPWEESRLVRYILYFIYYILWIAFKEVENCSKPWLSDRVSVTFQASLS